MDESRAPECPLARPLEALNGVGPKRVRALATRGLSTWFDLLNFVPLRYRTLPSLVPPDSLTPKTSVSVVGRITRLGTGKLRRGSFLIATLALEQGREGSIDALFYNQAWLGRRLGLGDRLLVSGRLGPTLPLRLIATDYCLLASNEEVKPHLERLRPEYSKIGGLAPGILRRLVETALDAASGLPDPIPDGLRQRYGVVRLADAFESLHRPSSLAGAEAGGARLLFDRFVALFLGLVAGEDRNGQSAPAIPAPPRIRERILARFPFAFTPEQEAALDVILEDLARTRPMRRLLQGDVGAGKTAVALAAALAVVAARAQVLFLVPTEPLARQHHDVLARQLDGSRVALRFLSARTSGSDRRELLLQLRAGALDIVVGTHAALAEDVQFSRLALVIIDEQQRFGVRQRLRARAKGSLPHVLALSATPIPRSLCLALLGDLDRTVIQGRPPGRKEVLTRLSNLDVALAAAKEALAVGERVFVVFPAIDADEIPSVEREGRALVAPGGALAGTPAAFLHGTLDEERRVAALGAFRNGRAPLLLSTVMVEVGIDVPEATIMIIAGAERFGLAALHQLRGRIGRGARPGRCFLVPGSRAGPDARARLGILEGESDGFRIAEEDLRFRGPGELSGVRQAGYGGALPFSGSDAPLFEQARAAALELHGKGIWRPGDRSYYDLLVGAVAEFASHPSNAV